MCERYLSKGVLLSNPFAILYDIEENEEQELELSRDDASFIFEASKQKGRTEGKPRRLTKMLKRQKRHSKWS